MTNEFDDQGFDFEEYEGQEETPPEESSNRTFWIAVGVLGIVILFTLVCLGTYFVFSGRTGGRAAQQTAAALAYAQQTEQARAVTQTAEASSWTATPTITPTSTNTPTPTQVLAQETEVGLEPSPDPRTATVIALLTQIAQSTPQNTPTSFPTELPDTGFADDVANMGLAGLIGLGFLAVVLIIIARQMRTASR